MIGTLQLLVPGWHVGTAAASLSPTSTVRAAVIPAWPGEPDDRRRGAVPGLRRVPIHHRPDAPGRRRLAAQV